MGFWTEGLQRKHVIENTAYIQNLREWIRMLILGDQFCCVPFKLAKDAADKQKKPLTEHTEVIIPSGLSSKARRFHIYIQTSVIPAFHCTYGITSLVGTVQ